MMDSILFSHIEEAFTKQEEENARLRNLVDDLIEEQKENVRDHAYYRMALFHYRQALERIQGMCGAPDAADACRNIIKFVDETLGSGKQDV